MNQLVLSVKKFFSSSSLIIAVSIFLLIPFYIFLYKAYSPRVNAFGCFDDCFNIVGGYFMIHGRGLYSQIFFNHQPLMLIISFLIQKSVNAINIYDLILRHRQVLLLFSFFMNAFLIMRFKWKGVAFTVFYELTKFFLFGDRFLAEGFIVYPITYVMGVIWYKYQGKHVYSIEYFFAALTAWFVIAMREPYAILAVLLFIALLLGKKSLLVKVSAVFIFLTFTIGTFLVMPINDYIFDVFRVNLSTEFIGEINATGLLSPYGQLIMWLYPINILISPNNWNFYRDFVVFLDFIFLFALSFFLIFSKKRKGILVMFILFGFANLRISIPVTAFFGAFHLLPWYGMFILFTCLLIDEVWNLKKLLAIPLIGLFIVLIGYVSFSPHTFLYDKVDPQAEFLKNFGNDLQVGEVVRILAQPTDTLFLDGADDLIYWQAKVLSPYKYSWYTSVMPLFPVYRKARLDMFSTNPPDFYYGSCPKQKIPNRTLPDNVKNDYVQFYSDGKPTCLYARKEKVVTFTQDQLSIINTWRYQLPQVKSNGI